MAATVFCRHVPCSIECTSAPHADPTVIVHLQDNHPRPMSNSLQHQEDVSESTLLPPVNLEAGITPLSLDDDATTHNTASAMRHSEKQRLVVVAGLAVILLLVVVAVGVSWHLLG